jgi:hypothetical protein
MTTCDPQDFKYLSSEDNARNNLLKDKVINDSGKILDFKSFDKKAKEFKDYASKLLKIDITSVITGARNGFVKFDKAVFRKVDKLRGYDKINAENIRKQLAELDKPTQEVKPGVQELFESNPELANQVYEALGFGKNIEFSEEKEIEEFKKDKSTKELSFDEIFKNETDAVTLKLWQSLKPYIRTNAKVYYQDNYFFAGKSELASEYGYAATIDGKGNVLIFDKAKLDSDTILHELLHDFLLDAINVNKDQVLINELQRIFDKVKQDTDLVERYSYAFNNLDEFVSEVFGNKGFRQELSYIKDFKLNKTSNIFESISKAIKDYLKNTFNFEINNTVLDNIFNAVEHTIKEKNQITPQQKQQALQLYSQYLDTIFPDSKVKDVFTLSTTFNLLKDPSKGIQSLISKYRAFKGFIVEPSNTGNLYPKNSMYKDYKVIINPKDGLIEENGREGYKIAVESRIHVLGSKQDIAGFKKFVAQPSTNVKEGVSELFDSTPELASIGTPQQYSAYLDTIFPDSQVKNVLYHGSLDKITKFNKDQHFGTSEQANLRVLRKADDENRYGDIKIYSAVVNVTNSKTVEDAGFDWSKEIKQGKEEGFDSLTYSNKGETYVNNKGEYLNLDNSYLIFDPKNSHILGSKQDIENFKEFVEKPKEEIKKPKLGEQGKLFFSRKPEEVNYMIKSLDILNSDKGKQVFEKGKKAGWSLEKTLTELQVPKEQKELILNLGKTDREEIITDLLANYSYAVEINTANEQSKYDYKLKEVDGKYFISYDNFKTQDEVDKNTYDSLEIPKTKVYSYLTVPGGTNYTENEIATPAITPSIKGHAEFATDQGIGWFRSDTLQNFVNNIVTKTRRILEVQSDLFQKGRDKKELISNFDNYGYYSEFQYTFTSNYLEIEDYKKEGWEEDGFRNGAYYFKRKNKDAVRNPNIPKNNFLQLLNKDNNWVTFFVKSIIQDSAKKGYEKVLFPSGNTASKIEGHTTLEQFKKQKEDRLKEIDVDTFTILDENGNAEGKEFNTEKEALDYINNSDNIDLRYIETKKFRKTEINQLKQELERVETEGFGALKPIFNFYENTVTNVLRKQGFSPKVIIDEYGNTWNEVEITPEMAEDYILFATKKTAVERMLTEGEVELREIIRTPDKQIVAEKLKNPSVIAKMKAIIDALGIKMEISDLGEEIAAQADILNRLIKFADDSITEDNFTEETIHFIVEILEQKDPKLYKMLESEIWKYQIYTNVRAEYSNFPEYRNADGSLNVAKIKKEAIGQLLVAKLLNQEEIKDEKNFWGSVWNTISNFIKDLFYKIPFAQRDEFQNLADRIMQEPDLITSDDVKYLSSKNKFFAKRTNNSLASSLARARKAFGTEKEEKFGSFKDEIDAFEFFKNMNSDIQKVTEKELNPNTNEYEDVDYYIYKGNKKQRVTTIISEANKKTFANISQDDVAKALREAKMQKGTDVHHAIQEILERYIDADTGLLREETLDAPLNINIPKEAYKRLENHLSNRLDTYPKGTRFLLETKIVNEEQGYGGTLDFIAFLPTGETDLLDWKTNNVVYWEAGERKKRFDVSPFNQTYWKTQLSFYKRALESNGVKNFRYTRAIPIAMETKQTIVDRTKPTTPDNVVYNITNLQVGNSEPRKIKKTEFYLVPVSLEEEKTGIKEIDDLVEKLNGIYERIRTSQYKKEEAYRKRQELDRLSSVIREIQTKRTATLFTNLFAENFDKFRDLTDVEFDFLQDIKGKKLLEKEQEDKIHSYFNEVYTAVEFLQTFQSFPDIVKQLYEEGEFTDYEKQVLGQVSKIESEASTILNTLINNSTEVMDKLGELYGIDKLSAEDNKNISNFTGFISILHREEKSIQFAARLINVIKFLGQKESKEFFDKDSGKFTKVFNAVTEWAKENKKPWKEVYSFLLAKDENGNPIRQLASKLNPEYRKELKDKQEEFEIFKKEVEQSLVDLGYASDVFDKKLAKEYKEHVISWLEKNYNLEEYDKNYEEALKKYKESIKDLRLDEDNDTNKKKKKKLLQSWINDHDIYSSPSALSLKTNYLLYGEGILKEEKWYSEEYKFLKQEGNEPLLEAYNLFTSLNQRAQDNGMLDDVFSARLWIPNIPDPSLRKAAFVALKDGSSAAWYSISKVKDFLQRHIGFLTSKDVEGNELNYDPLTGKEIRKIPIKYKYVDVPEIEKKENESEEDFEKRKQLTRKEAEAQLSDDLFEVYAKWADHIIKYEILSNYENRFKMVQLLESLKTQSTALDSKGNIVQKRDKSGLKTLESQLTSKDPKIESELNQIINTYVYSSSLDVKPEYYKLANALYDYAALNFLGLNVTSWVSNIVGATFAARTIEGKWFKKNDFLNVGISTTLGVFNDDLAKYGKDLFIKSRYLINELDTRILSEYDSDPSSEFKTKGKFALGDIAFAGFRLGDHFIQDSIATSIFVNTTIINGKFVNINDYVKAEYNSKIFDENISSKERNDLIKERDEKIEKMKREENLFRFIKEENGVFKIEGIDFNTTEGKAEMLKYQNTVAHYIKQSIGNVDDFDKSINRMTWGWKFVMQFKNWMPRVIGSRFNDVEYQYEFDDYHYGRSRIFLDSFRNNFLVTLKEMMKSLVEVIPFVDRNTGSIDMIKAAKDAYIRKKVEAIRQNKKFDLTEDQFVDIYITGFKNQLTAFTNILQVSGAVILIAFASAGDEDKWYWKILYKTYYKVRREMLFEYDPNQTISFFSQGVFPALSVLAEFTSVFAEIKKEVFEPKKGKPISAIIKTIPVLRELHYWLSAMSKDYAKMLGVKQPNPQSLL